MLTLVAAREAKGLSKVEAALQLGISDVSLANWEKGKVNLNTERLTKLATLYGIAPTDLLVPGQTPSPSPPPLPRSRSRPQVSRTPPAPPPPPAAPVILSTRAYRLSQGQLILSLSDTAFAALAAHERQIIARLADELDEVLAPVIA